MNARPNSARYVSTRGQAPELGFDEVLLAGLGRDGGLYLPAAWPTFDTAGWRALRGASYQDVAVALMAPFVAGAVSRDDLQRLVEESYAGFRHPAVAPLKQLGAND